MWNLKNTGIEQITGISLASHTSGWELPYERGSISGTPCARPSWQKGEWTAIASTWLQTCCCCYWNVCGWSLASGKGNAKVEAALIVFCAYFIRQLTVWEGWRFTIRSKNPTGVILIGTADVIYVRISGNDHFYDICSALYTFLTFI